MAKCKCSAPSSILCQVLILVIGRYGVILDAGSSGTRVHIYRWLDSARARLNADMQTLKSLPQLKTKKKWTKKIHPGVSTFGERPTAVGPEHLKELLDHALDVIPASQVADTPIFLMATAGVRLLPNMQQKLLLSEICAYARAHTKFSLPDCDLHIQVIPGETEGLYGWIAANYLLGGFDAPEDHAHGKGHHTYGFLDMGGASAQIAFAPNATEAIKHANDLKLLRMRTLDGIPAEYKVFVTTWLGFGVNEARRRYVQNLIEASNTNDARELQDPCLPVGLSITFAGEEITADTKPASETEPFLIGTGRFDECLKHTYPLLDKDAPCVEEPCLLHGQHVPAIDFDVNHFVGVSEYWHTTHEVFEMSHKDKAYDFNTYQSRVRDFCSQEWEDIEKGISSKKWGKKVDEHTAMEVCFKASWLINVLHDGIGIPRVGLEKVPSGHNGTKEVLEHAKEKGFLEPFQAVDKIDDTEVSWTLGKMILYASGQVEPRGESLPVGFGSNVAGVPPDFQYAGSKYEPLPDSSFDDLDDWSDTADEFLEKASPRSTPALLLFLLVLVFVGFLFRKRERRQRVYNKVNTMLRRNTRWPGSPRKGAGRSFFSSGKLFGRASGNYERVLEDGEAAHEFELQDVDSDENEASDSSEGSRLGRTSGLATPKLNIMGFEPVGTFFDSAPSPASGVGLGPENLRNMAGLNAMDRSGLVVRTESRERLAPGLGLLGAGRRSRTGSPTRGKSPLMSPLEED
jgi:Golgi apyrase